MGLNLNHRTRILNLNQEYKEKYEYYEKLNDTCANIKYETGQLKWYEFKTKVHWSNVIMISIFHFIGFYAVLTFPYLQNLTTFLWGLFIGSLGGFGVTAGVHRYWSHRSYKANLPFRILLMLCFSSSGQNSIFDWVRDHRVHHKFSETDADPHNANRGFFFAHVGWLMMKKHPEVLRKGAKINMDDVLSDPVVQFNQKFFWDLKILLCFILPVIVPIYCWNESFGISFQAQLARYILSLNFTWLVNSAAHIWGNKPYNKHISPTENLSVAFFTGGEGWHNYHHVFPWDYKAAELGNGFFTFNYTTWWLDIFSKIGWVYDLKTASSNLIEKTVERHGDGSWRKKKHRIN